MIKDSSIDLTMESKFGQEDPIFVPTQRTINFPWNKPTPIIANSQIRPHRSYGDILSDEMDMVVRRDFNNKWFFGDIQPLKKSYFWYVFYEILYELGLTQQTYQQCPKCGKYHFTKEFFTTCKDCAQEQQYKYTYNKLFPRKYNELFIPWNEIRRHRFNTPKAILQALL